VTIGLSSSPAAVYSAEIASPKLRGRLTCLTSLAIAVGILMIYTFGFFFPVTYEYSEMVLHFYDSTVTRMSCGAEKNEIQIEHVFLTFLSFHSFTRNFHCFSILQTVKSFAMLP
jgi:Sugar (and other) transporter